MHPHKCFGTRIAAHGNRGQRWSTLTSCDELRDPLCIDSRLAQEPGGDVSKPDEIQRFPPIDAARVALRCERRMRPEQLHQCGPVPGGQYHCIEFSGAAVAETHPTRKKRLEVGIHSDAPFSNRIDGADVDARIVQARRLQGPCVECRFGPTLSRRAWEFGSACTDTVAALQPQVIEPLCVSAGLRIGVACYAWALVRP